MHMEVVPVFSSVDQFPPFMAFFDVIDLNITQDFMIESNMSFPCRPSSSVTVTCEHPTLQGCIFKHWSVVISILMFFKTDMTFSPLIYHCC